MLVMARAAAECLVAYMELLHLVAAGRRQVVITKYYSAAQAERFRRLWEEHRVSERVAERHCGALWQGTALA